MHIQKRGESQTNQLAIASISLGVFGILSFIVWLNITITDALISDLLFPTPSAMGFFLGCFGIFSPYRKFRYLGFPGIILSLIPFIWWFSIL